MLWTRSKTELPWGRKKAAVCVFLYPKTDCNYLTGSFSNSLPWSEWSVSGGPNTENTRSMKWRTVVRAALSLIGIKRQVEWNGRWQKGWSDFLVTNFYTRRDRQQRIGMRVWQGGVPQAINLGGRWEDLRCWQDRHASIWVRTSVDIVGHQTLSRIVSNAA